MKRTRLSTIALATASAAALVTGGCDPKFPNGVEDNVSDIGDGGGSNVATLSKNAVATGAIVAFHTELLAGALAVAGDHDVPPAPGIRSFLGTDCMTISVVDALAPIHAFDLNACTDANGTEYGGVGTFEPPIDATDGFLLYPDYSETGAIGAANSGDPDLNHTLSSGTLVMTFSRNGGVVSGVTVSNLLRHFVRSTPNVSFSYSGVTFTGGIGEMGPYPDNGGVIHVAWDGVGVFDINFDGGPHASYRMEGQDYVVNLDTGEVKFSTVPIEVQ
ncbi:MAG TPA: hypothetical protein VKU85_08945 [bacterium]|nr:hypothetical protein [bacterium]